MGIGVTEYLVIAVVLLILFGPNKLPELGRAFGKMLREFKNSTRGIIEDDVSSGAKEQPVVAATNPSIPMSTEEKNQQTDSRRLPD